MTLSPSSAIVIDLVLLSDAIALGDVEVARSLARRIGRTAIQAQLRAVAKLAAHVETLASRSTPAPALACATRRLVAEAEREIIAQTGKANDGLTAAPDSHEDLQTAPSFDKRW